MFIKWKKIRASLLVVTLLIMSYCTLCLIFWQNDHKLLLATIVEVKKEQQLAARYQLIYNKLQQTNKLKIPELDVEVDGEIYHVQHEKHQDNRLIIYQKNHKKQTLRHKIY